jgi:hypothetical protein
MRIFARRSLAVDAAALGEPALLLEGSWPDRAAAKRCPGATAYDCLAATTEGQWSLDDAIDARYAWIDEAAARLAAEVAACAAERESPFGAQGDDNISLAYLNELALRYFIVKLLRVVAFFETYPPAPGERLTARLARGKDDAYAELLGEIARYHGASWEVAWSDSEPAHCVARQHVPWRRWAAQVKPVAAPRLLANRSSDETPRVILCGNPRILDPVCAELVERQARVWWLYEQFAVRCWWRWCWQGVEQLTCDAASRPTPPVADVWLTRDIRCRGIRLTGAINVWLRTQAAAEGQRQAAWLAPIERHLRDMRPTAIILDEDATPLKRAMVAVARRHGASSVVVQHGAPCGRFGFSPLAADNICVWNEATHEQLLQWDVPDERIAVVGWPRPASPSVLRPPRLRRAGMLRAQRGEPHFLLLATVPPSDSRPDTVEFHLTGRNHEAMLEMVCAVVAEHAAARLTVKLHPRAADVAVLKRVLARWPKVRTTIVRRKSLAALLATTDCVLSCASTAGIEAALVGAPVVQLLPLGSGNVLPASQWGLVGSARTENELRSQVAAALKRGWVEQPAEAPLTVPETGRSAAARVVNEACSAAPMAFDSRGGGWLPARLAERR